ncbi:MAG: phasin family protein [Spirulinaceae cyanobacterium SM2_1_0]|nr:phasin family protein [Spirulinaceae cyanobacterium SM2_1_0]
MAGFGNLLQKAFYLGVGIASYAGEKAGSTLQDLRTQAQKLADEMVKRGEMNAEEASRFVDDLVRQAQKTPDSGNEPAGDRQPRRIEILDDEPDDADRATADDDTERLRQQVAALQAELQRLQNES